MLFLQNILLYLILFQIIIEKMAEFNYNRIKVELAEQMGKSETTVSRWVSNKAQVSPSQMYEIARLLKVEVFSLLKSIIEK